MKEWGKFNEISLPEKEGFYSDLNMKNITDTDEMHAKRVWKDFETKKLGDYCDLYLKGDTFLLADVCKIFRKMCIKIYNPDPAKFPSASVLAWQVALKKLK